MSRIGNDQQDQNREIPNRPDIRLNNFRAEPASIEPFGASILSWNVEADADFRVKLNDLEVRKVGRLVVQPTATTVYHLYAYGPLPSGDNYYVELGETEVALSIKTCTTLDLTPKILEFSDAKPSADLKSVFEAALKAYIEDDKDLYFRNDPIAIFSLGRIQFQLRLRARRGEFPDPYIDIDGSFGLSVNNGNVVTTSEEISVNISVPDWVWAIPFLDKVQLSIELATAKVEADQKTRKALNDMATNVNFVALLEHPDPASKSLHSISIVIINTIPRIFATYCPDNLLVQLATISKVAPPIQEEG